MIVIQQGVWRADAIASIDIEGKNVLVLPNGCDTYIEYTYGCVADSLAAYKDIILKWENELHALRPSARDNGQFPLR